MLIDYQLGATSIILRVKIRSSTTGNGVTGLTGSSTGLIISTIADSEATATTYTAAATHIQTIATKGTYAAPSASECRFSEVDSTNHPGVYEIQLANARLDVSGSLSLLISITGVSGMLDCDVVVPLRAVNPYDGVHFGLTALPNTACTTNASLLTSGTGTDQISNSSGKVLLQATQTGVTIPTVTTVTNQLTGAAIATAIWEDTTAGGDFGTSGSIGKLIATTGVPANVTTWSGTAVASPSVAGVPIIDVHYVGGTAAGIYTGTAQAGANTSITLTSGDTAPSNGYAGRQITLVGGTGIGQAAYISAFNSSTKVATTYCTAGTAGAWVTNPDSTSQYSIDGLLDVNVALILQTLSKGSAGYVGIDWGQVANKTTSNALTATTISTSQVAASVTAGVTVSTNSDKTGHSLTTAPPTAAAIATAVWQDTTSGDFTTASSIGKSLYTSGVVPGGAGGHFIAGTNAATTITTSLTTHLVGTVDTVTTVTNQLTGAAIATAIWTDTTSGDFTTSTSPGKIIFTQLGDAFTTASSSVFSTASLANAPSGTGASAATIATAVWQDTTASSDFTTSGSIGKLIATTGITAAAVTGAVGSVTGAVGSVTGNVGGSVGSVTGAVNVSLTQALSAARALDSIADTSLTMNDALHCAVAGATGKQSVSGTSYVIETPSTGTTLRTFTLNSSSAPTSRS